jgi:hypothetical protein
MERTLTGDWRLLNNEELNYIHSPLITIVIVIGSMKKIWTGCIASTRTSYIHIGFWWGKREVQILVGRSSHSYEYNIETDFI